MTAADFSDCLLIAADGSGANWDEVERRIEALGPGADRNLLWGAAAKNWVKALASKTPGPMQVTETMHFMTMTMFPDELQGRFATGIDEIHDAIMAYLGRAGVCKRWGKLVVLVCQVSYEDGGQAALQKLFGVGLEDLFRSFLAEF